MTSLPLLDMSSFLDDPGSASAAAFIEALTVACHEVGFVYIVGHGVDPEVEDRVFAAATRFFALPEPDRLEIVNTRSPHFRGYTRLGHEHTNGVSDRRDQIDIGPERPEPAVADDAPRWMRLRGPNQWPPAVPEMQPDVSAWMVQMERVGRAVLRALAVGLGQPADRFDPVVADDPEVLVKIIRYPAAPSSDPSQGVGAHHDSGLLTFIMQDSVGGLQVLRGDTFVDAPRIPGAYILNLGEMLQLATDGYLRATKHRVLSPRGAQRISIAYFFNPAMEATLAPVELPARLAALAPGGQNANPDDPVLSTYGDNWLKFRVRSHPDVAAIHHPDLVTGATNC
ncbi:MAG: isopenicillin synthase family oxygenase [Ilumatobacteraceae bacterium]|nr:isopenicillin synthase family oxygenase [Ilumatobacteraceae bacterium]